MTKKIRIVSAEDVHKLWVANRNRWQGEHRKEKGLHPGYKPATAMTISDFQNLAPDKWQQKLVEMWEERKEKR